MFLFFVLPLTMKNGMPYVTEEGGDLLVDSGAASTYLRRALLETDGPVATRARGAGGVAVERTNLQLPSDVAGILGFDWLGAGSSWELDLVEGSLRVDEPESAGGFDGAGALELTARDLGGTRPYPTVAVDVYGASDCVVAALVDTGSPATIANEALAAAAGLFPGDDDGDDAIASRGAVGELVGLRRCRASGLVLGGRLERPGLDVLVGDLPQWGQLDATSASPALLLGLDALGSRIRAAKRPPPRKKSRAVAVDADGAPRRRKKSRADLRLDPPRAGDVWSLTLGRR